MQSQGGLSEVDFVQRIKQFAGTKWDSLSNNQKTFAKKAWGVLTYKWRWQIAMNVPYMAIFLLDRTIPSVHQFNVSLVVMVTSKLPLPAFVSSWIGLG